MTRPLLAAAFALGLAACAGNPQRLPVGLSLCNAVAAPGGFAVRADVENKGNRPISNMTLAVSFYRNFRYSTYTGTAALRKELDPGRKREIDFAVSGPPGTQSGEAIHCLITHIGYLDGTSVDLPPSN